MELAQLPALNAVLNGLSGCLLVCGYASIRAKRVPLHRAFMLGAFAVSVIFLTSYLIYHFNQPVKPYPGEGFWQVFYYIMLFTHVVLAVAVPPLALITLYRALKGQFDRHRRIARITFPVWLYVSVTGVLVYLMLYQW